MSTEVREMDKDKIIREVLRRPEGAALLAASMVKPVRLAFYNRSLSKHLAQVETVEGEGWERVPISLTCILNRGAEGWKFRDFDRQVYRLAADLADAVGQAILDGFFAQGQAASSLDEAAEATGPDMEGSVLMNVRTFADHRQALTVRWGGDTYSGLVFHLEHPLASGAAHFHSRRSVMCSRLMPLEKMVVLASPPDVGECHLDFDIRAVDHTEERVVLALEGTFRYRLFPSGIAVVSPSRARGLPRPR